MTGIKELKAAITFTGVKKSRNGKIYVSYAEEGYVQLVPEEAGVRMRSFLNVSRVRNLSRMSGIADALTAANITVLGF